MRLIFAGILVATWIPAYTNGKFQRSRLEPISMPNTAAPTSNGTELTLRFFMSC